MEAGAAYPVTLAVDYPERQSRWKTLLRLFLAIPVFIFALFIVGANGQWPVRSGLRSPSWPHPPRPDVRLAGGPGHAGRCVLLIASCSPTATPHSRATILSALTLSTRKRLLPPEGTPFWKHLTVHAPTPLCCLSSALGIVAVHHRLVRHRITGPLSPGYARLRGGRHRWRCGCTLDVLLPHPRCTHPPSSLSRGGWAGRA